VTAEFREAVRGLHATAASHSARKVVEALDRHGRDEAELLEQYQRFVDEAESPALRYLVRLIVEDEKRHHRLLEDLANTIAWGSVKGGPEHVLSFPVRFHDEALRSETRALLRHELRDRTQLRRLRRRLRAYGDVASWQLLIDSMRLDTTKHIHILRFILDYEVRTRRFGRILPRVRWDRASRIPTPIVR
jgi:hypothetical protein